MICGIIKWMISQSLDANDRAPAFVDRHVKKCSSCRQFLATSKLIGDILERDAKQILFKPAFVDEGHMRRDYSLQLAVLAACVLIMSGFLMLDSVRTARVDETAMLNDILPGESIAGLLAGSIIPARILADGVDGCLGREIDFLAQDVRSAAEYIAGSLPFGVPELN